MAKAKFVVILDDIGRNLKSYSEIKRQTPNWLHLADKNTNTRTCSKFHMG